MRQTIATAEMTAIIPSNRSCKILMLHDTAINTSANCIERCFNKPKHFRRAATRDCRRAVHFFGLV